MGSDSDMRTVADYEDYCRQILPPATYNYYYGAYGDAEWSTYTANRDAIDAVKFRPRVLCGARERQLSTDLLGCELSLPVVVGPTGKLSELDRDAEVATVRAAGTAGTLFVLSSIASAPTEEVAAAATGPWWQQIFLFKDRGLTEWQVTRAVELGAGAIVLTVSFNERWQRMRYPSSATASSAKPASNLDGYRGAVVPSYTEMVDSIDGGAQWEDVDWLRSLVTVPVIVKGIQTAEDARLCLEHGADGLVVSNHGGRAAPGARGTMEALPEIVAAVNGGLEVCVDGGFRQGSDVLKALALGAKTVWIGRAARWAQAVGGEAGVINVLDIFRDDLQRAMALCGVQDVASIERTLVTGEIPAASLSSAVPSM